MWGDWETSRHEIGDYGASGSSRWYDETVAKYAVALSRLSNHPVSRAMVESEAAEDDDVSVISFEQVWFLLGLRGWPGVVGG
jgi:cation transport ATPase